MASWDDVRALGLELPEVEESTSYRMPALRIAGKLIACLSPHDRGALSVRCDRDERPFLLAARPDVFFLTPHYEKYPFVLVSLETADRDTLAERLEDAWLLAAPKRLVAAFAQDA